MFNWHYSVIQVSMVLDQLQKYQIRCKFPTFKLYFQSLSMNLVQYFLTSRQHVAFCHVWVWLATWFKFLDSWISWYISCAIHNDRFYFFLIQICLESGRFTEKGRSELRVINLFDNSNSWPTETDDLPIIELVFITECLFAQHNRPQIFFSCFLQWEALPVKRWDHGFISSLKKKMVVFSVYCHICELVNENLLTNSPLLVTHPFLEFF